MARLPFPIDIGPESLPVITDSWSEGGRRITIEFFVSADGCRHCEGLLINGRRVRRADHVDLIDDWEERGNGEAV